MCKKFASAMSYTELRLFLGRWGVCGGSEGIGCRWGRYWCVYGHRCTLNGAKRSTTRARKCISFYTLVGQDKMGAIMAL